MKTTQQDLSKMTINQLHDLFVELSSNTIYHIIAQSLERNGKFKRKQPYIDFIKELVR